MLFSLMGLYGVVFIVMAAFAIIFARKFYILKDMVMISISDMLFVFEVFKHYDEIESPEQHLAMLSKLSPEEVARLHAEGDDLEIIKQVSTSVLERMKASVPGGYDIIASHKCTLMPPQCQAPK